jgi:hypothetical protein
MERKHTITSVFIVPTLSIGKDKLLDNGFLNGYIKDGKRDIQYYIKNVEWYLIFNSSPSLEKIVEVKILFHPKKVFSVTPQVAESKSIYHVYPNGNIDHYDMIYIRKDTMPLLIGIGNNYYLDEWLEIKSWELLHKKISELYDF